MEATFRKTGLVEVPVLKSKISAVLSEEGVLGVGSPATIKIFPRSATLLFSGSKNDVP
jgi:hypothetical protein